MQRRVVLSFVLVSITSTFQGFHLLLLQLLRVANAVAIAVMLLLQPLPAAAATSVLVATATHAIQAAIATQLLLLLPVARASHLLVHGVSGLICRRAGHRIQIVTAKQTPTVSNKVQGVARTFTRSLTSYWQ